MTHEVDVNRRQKPPMKFPKLPKSRPAYRPKQTTIAKANAKLALPKLPGPEEP
jgi:hypothetical protein